ncbi:hypothetical protein [Caballeronia sp. 15711]|uniref:hypothetical protein n=1 Tax=Caballeronia sp. 15711 TaxID=3391029 RepID=UPI0039E6F0C7
MLSRESLAFDEGVGAAPCHGEIIIAFAPAVFAGEASTDNVKRAESLFEAIVGQGARLPSQRRFEARQRSLQHGVSLSKDLYDELTKLIS